MNQNSRCARRRPRTSQVSLQVCHLIIIRGKVKSAQFDNSALPSHAYCYFVLKACVKPNVRLVIRDWINSIFKHLSKGATQTSLPPLTVKWYLFGLCGTGVVETRDALIYLPNSGFGRYSLRWLADGCCLSVSQPFCAGCRWRPTRATQPLSQQFWQRAKRTCGLFLNKRQRTGRPCRHYDCQGTVLSAWIVWDSLEENIPESKQSSRRAPLQL